MSQSLSGLESFDPSGSTPQPAPLSGLALPSLFGGMGGEQGMSGGGGPGGAGGALGGPGLDFFQLLGSLTGSGDSGITATAPNLSSLFGPLGSGGIGSGNLGQMDGNGSFGGFGQAGGFSQPQAAPQGAQGVAGASGGQLDSIALIRQALGLGQKVLGSGGVAGNTSGTGGSGGLSIGDFEGASLSNPEGIGTASPFQPGDLTSSFLNDPMLGQFATQGGLFHGAQVTPELWDSFKSDPQFLEALRSGNALGDSNLLGDSPFGAGSLEMPDFSGSAGGGGGFGLGDIGSGFGGANSLLGLVQNFQNPGAMTQNPLGVLQNLYGLYTALNSGLSLGGPTIGGAISGLGGSLGAGLGSIGSAAGAAVGIPAAVFAALGATDFFDKSAQGFQNNIRNTFGAVPGQVQSFRDIPGLLGGINADSSPDDIANAWWQLQNRQDAFQDTGVENLLKSAGHLTGENTKFGFFGGGDNYSADYPNIQGVANAIAPGMLGTTLGRLKLADLYGQKTGSTLGKYGIEDYAKMFAPQDFQNAIDPWNQNQTAYPNHLDWTGHPIDISPEQNFIQQNIQNYLRGIAPGQYEQGLADLFAPYGGFGNAHPLVGPGNTNYNDLLMAPSANALGARIGLTPEQQASMAGMAPTQYFDPQAWQRDQMQQNAWQSGGN